eukprot:355057-Chlamydomonas_euryale.AAC.3
MPQTLRHARCVHKVVKLCVPSGGLRALGAMRVLRTAWRGAARRGGARRDVMRPYMADGQVLFNGSCKCSSFLPQTSSCVALALVLELGWLSWAG